MAMSLRGVLKLVYPINKGQIEDFTALEKIFHDKIYSVLRVDPQERSFAIITPPATLENNLLKICEMMFETFSVRSLYLIPEPICISLYHGYLNSVVVNAGSSYTYIAHIKNGSLNLNTLKLLNYGFNDVGEYFVRLLRQHKRIDSVAPAERDLLKNILAEHGYVKSSHTEMNTPIQLSLSDGEVFECADELFMAPECLFQPNLCGIEQPGIITAISEFTRENALQIPIIIGGGCSMLHGYVERLKDEIKGEIIAKDERNNQEWLGASMLIKQELIEPITIAHYKQEHFKILDYMPII